MGRSWRVEANLTVKLPTDEAGTDATHTVSIMSGKRSDLGVSGVLRLRHLRSLHLYERSAPNLDELGALWAPVHSVRILE